MTSDRIYRRAFPIGKAVDNLKDGRGTQFDPRLLDAFLGSLDEAVASSSFRARAAAST